MTKNHLISGLLVASLILGPVSTQSQSTRTDQDRQRQCVKLLEEIGPANQERAVSGAAAGTGVSLPVHVLDLSRSGEAEVVEQIARSNRSDVLVLSDSALASDRILAAVKATPALFSMKAPSADLEQIQAALRLPVLQPEIVVALPLDSRGVHRTFGTSEDIAAPQVEYLNKIMPEFAGLRGGSILATPRAGVSIADSVVAAAGKEGHHGLFVVVAHNRGGVLQFPDGSNVSVASIYQTLERRSRPGLILSCDTVQSSGVPPGAVLTNAPLDVVSIAHALGKMETGISKIGSPVFADVLRVLGESLYSNPPNVGPHIKVLVFVAGGLLLVFAAMYFWDCDRRGNCSN